ncbi:MAG: YoaK family protein [Janthinobacterium lividum]
MKSRKPIAAGLMLASVGSGYLDVLCFRFLGEVLPSAMTGNLALLGRSLGEGDLLAATRNVCAFGGFFGGVLIGAALMRRSPGKARFLLTLTLQVAVLLGVALLWHRHAEGALRFGLIGAASVGMGLQSAVAHRIGIHAVSTTYFTGTTANIAFGLVSPDKPAQPAATRFGWPVLALACYVAGAALSAWDVAGRLLPTIPIGVPALPVATTLVLAISIMTVRLDDQRPLPLGKRE